MPYKPPKPCAYPGCPALTHSKYCEKHQYLQKQKEHAYNIARDQGVRKFYGSDWVKRRNQFLVEHPFCEICRQHGHLVKAEHVHHIVAVRDGGTNEESNLVSLCKGCHSQLHGKRGDYKKKYKTYTY